VIGTRSAIGRRLFANHSTEVLSRSIKTIRHLLEHAFCRRDDDTAVCQRRTRFPSSSSSERPMKARRDIGRELDTVVARCLDFNVHHYASDCHLPLHNEVGLRLLTNYVVEADML
jgi:hypothetical protein